MKLPVRVMGCGQSKSASGTVKDQDRNQDDHLDVYSKTSDNPASSVKTIDPLTPSFEEYRDSQTLMTLSHNSVKETSSGGSSGLMSIPASQPQQQQQNLQVPTTQPQNGNIVKRPTDSREQDRPALKTAFKDRQFSPASLQTSANITGSQLEFFRLLDEKIELGGGGDYSSTEEEQT